MPKPDNKGNDKKQDSSDNDNQSDSSKGNSNPFKQFETLIVKNKNINTHPKLAEMLDEYTLGVADGYAVSEEILDAIVQLSPEDPQAASNYEALLHQLHISGYINEAPVVSGPAALATVAEDSSDYLISQEALLVNATDADDPVLTAFGLTMLSGDGTLTDNEDGTWSYTPAPDDDTEVSFGYWVTDNIAPAVEAVATLDITPVNDAPALEGVIDDQSSSEDTAWDLPVPAGLFSDIDSPVLAYSATLADDTALPAWLNFDSGSQTFSGLPPLNFNGDLELKVIASDGELSAFTTFKLTILPVNDAPVVANAIADQSSPEDTAWSFQVPANTFSDVDNAVLTYGASLDDGSALPAWLNFDEASQTFSGQPPQDFYGSLNLKVSASDGDLSGSATFSLEITPVNDAPVTSTVTLAPIDEDSGTRIITAAEFLSNAIDIDSSTLTVSNVTVFASGSPGSDTKGGGETKDAGGTPLKNDGSGNWYFTPDANDDTEVTFVYDISDGIADPVKGDAVLDILPVNDAPTTSTVTLAPIAEDSSGRLITQADLLSNASDIDSSVLSAKELKISSGNGALMDNTDGTWTYVPTVGDTSEVALTYQVSDGSLNVAGTATMDIEPLLDGLGQDGYFTGSNVFADENENRSADSTEAKSLTDAGGGFSLALPRGSLVLEGGTDIATGLAFRGQLRAPEGYTMITPVTTLVRDLMQLGNDLATAEQLVKSAFGIGSAFDLAKFDPIARTVAGDTDGSASFTAGSLILNTVTLISSLLVGSGSSALAAQQTVFSAIAKQLNDNPGTQLDLGDSSVIAAIINKSAAGLGSSLVSGTADMVATLNKSAQVKASETGAGTELLSAVSAVSKVAQGTASDSLVNVGSGSETIETVAAAYAATNLETAIKDAESTLGDVNGPGINTPPTAVADTYSTDEDTAITGNLLANDKDADNDSLKVTSTGTLTSALGATVTVSSNGAFDYDPSSSSTLQALNNGQTKADSFAYSISDGNGGVSSATAMIDIAGITDQTTKSTLATYIPAGTDLQYYMRIADNSGKFGNWITLDAIFSGLQASGSSGSTSGGAGAGKASFEHLQVVTGSNLETMNLFDALPKGIHIPKVEIEAYTMNSKGKQFLVDEYNFGSLQVIEAVTSAFDRGFTDEVLTFSYGTYTHGHATYDGSGKAPETAKFGWSQIDNKAITAPDVTADYANASDDQLSNSAGELTYYLRFDNTDSWLRLDDFTMGMSTTANGFQGGGGTVSDIDFTGAQLTFGAGAETVQLLKNLLKGTFIGSVEIEAYSQADSKAPNELVEEYLFSNVLVEDLSISGPGAEVSATLQFEEYTRGHLALDLTTGIPELGTTGWDRTENQSIPSNYPDSDFNILNLSPTTSADLTYFMRVSDLSGNFDQWIEVNHLDVGFSRLVQIAGSGGTNTGHLEVSEMSIEIGTSAESIRLMDYLPKGVVIPKVEIEAYANAGSKGKQLIEEYHLGSVLVTSIDTNGTEDAAPNETLTLNFGTYSHGHNILDDKGTVKNAETFGWSFLKNDEITAPAVKADYNETAGNLAGTAGSLEYFLSLDEGTTWIELTSISSSQQNSVTMGSSGLQGGKANFSGFEITMDSSAQSNLLGDHLTAGAPIPQVEIEAYASGGSKGQQLIAEYNLGTVLVEDLSTTGPDTEVSATLKFADYSRALITLDETGKQSSTTATGWNLIEGKAQTGPTPQPSGVHDTIIPVSAPSELLYFMRISDSTGSGNWVTVQGFDAGLENIAALTSDDLKSGKTVFQDLVVSVGSSSETVRLMDYLPKGDTLEMVEIEAYTIGGDGPLTLVDEYLFGKAVVSNVESSGQNLGEPENNIAFKFGTFIHSHQILDSKTGVISGQESYGWDLTKNAELPTTSSFLGADYGEAGPNAVAIPSGPLQYYIKLGDGADWLALASVNMSAEIPVSISSGAGGGILVSKASFSGLEFSAGTSAETIKLTEYLTSGQTLDNVEIEAYAAGGSKGSLQLVDEYQFDQVLVSDLYFQGLGTEISATLDFGQYTHAHLDYDSTGTKVSNTEFSGWDQTKGVELVGQTPVADVLNLLEG